MAETDIRQFNINFGPQHPAAHGVLRLVLELDGEVVERVDPHIGLLHRGTEKLIEHKTYLQAIGYFDRLDYVAPMNQEHAFCMAAERLLGLEIPRRAQLIRVLLFRNRPSSFASAQRDDAGYGRRRSDTSAVGLRRARKTDGVLRTRLGIAYARQILPHRRRSPGPARRTDPGHFRLSATRIRTVLDDIETLLTDNRIFKQRNVDIGVVSLDECFQWGFSGVIVRGSGAAWDLRRAQPYECYNEMEFDIPIGKNGDCYDRYLIRMQEMREVGRIMKQCCNLLLSEDGRGPMRRSRTPKVVPPKRGEMKRSMEGLIHHFKLYTEGVHVPDGEVYACVEAPKGEFGVYLVSDGSNKPYRCKIRAPGFAHLQAMDFMNRGHHAR